MLWIRLFCLESSFSPWPWILNRDLNQRNKNETCLARVLAVLRSGTHFGFMLTPSSISTPTCECSISILTQETANKAEQKLPAAKRAAWWFEVLLYWDKHPSGYDLFVYRLFDACDCRNRQAMPVACTVLLSLKRLCTHDGEPTNDCSTNPGKAQMQDYVLHQYWLKIMFRRLPVED